MRATRLFTFVSLFSVATYLIVLLYDSGAFHLTSQGHPKVITQHGNTIKQRGHKKVVKVGERATVAGPRRRYLTPQLPGRLGNSMFAYASMLGIAARNGLIPVFPARHHLRNIFKITAANYSQEGVRSWYKVREVTASAYDPRTENLHDVDADMLELNGYFQSWRYFSNIKDAVRREFAFADNIQARADSFIMSGLKHVFGPNMTRADVTLIGVHVRRGDMESEVNVARGYTVAGADYLSHAAAHFEAQFPLGGEQRAAFIVCSDDPEWADLHRPRTSLPVIPARFNSDSVDLAILASCDHVVMTTGTYGWWGAFLAGGQTVYYADYARVNSSLHREIVAEDFFCPGWTPLL